MTFYNPGSLLASPEAAVKPPPVSNTAAFAIGSAMESIRSFIGKKQQVDSLKSDTEALAAYMDNRSPDLAAMLRTKIDSYKPTAFTGYDAIDVDKEKSSLLSGVISLYGQELNSNKLDASGNSIALQNNYGAKLRAAESQASNINNNWNTWESNETRRETEYEGNRRRLASEGNADGIPPYVRGVNPYTAQKSEAEANYNRLLNADQSQIMGMATPSKMSRRGSVPLPSTGIVTPMTTEEQVADQDRALEGELPTPEQVKGLPADYGGFLDMSPPPEEDQSSVLFPQSPGHAAAIQSTENPPEADPPRPDSDSPMPELTPAQRAAAMTGANEGIVNGEITPPSIASAPTANDPVARLNEVSKQRKAGNIKVITGSLDQLIGGIKREKGSYIKPDVADQAIAAGETVREDILSLPDPGSDEWITNSRTILSAYKASIATLQRNSSAGEKKEEQVANQEQLQYYIKDSINKDPITVYKRIQDGIPRFYILEGGKETEVTNRIGVDFIPLVSGASTPSSSAPGAKIKSLQDLLK